MNLQLFGGRGGSSGGGGVDRYGEKEFQWHITPGMKKHFELENKKLDDLMSMEIDDYYSEPIVTMSNGQEFSRARLDRFKNNYLKDIKKGEDSEFGNLEGAWIEVGYKDGTVIAGDPSDGSLTAYYPNGTKKDIKPKDIKLTGVVGGVYENAYQQTVSGRNIVFSNDNEENAGYREVLGSKEMKHVKIGTIHNGRLIKQGYGQRAEDDNWSVSVALPSEIANKKIRVRNAKQ